MGATTADYQPRVSVALTAYNRAKYIGQAIESVLAQTFSEFELLIVDDCSQDDTAAVARSYMSDPRVRVYVNDHTLGQFPNRNRAAEYARGEFLKYHDSDDILYPHCLEVMLRALETEPTGAFAVSCFKRWIGGPCPVLSTPLMTYRRDLLGAEGIMWAAPGHCMFRLQAFRQLGCYPDMGAFSDSLFLIRACAQVSVVLVPADLFWYRSHAQQEPVAAGDWARRCAAMWTMLKGADCPLEADELEMAKRNWCWRVGRYAWEEAIRGRWMSARTIVRGSGIAVSEWFRYCRRPRRSDEAGVVVNQNGEYPIPEWVSTSQSDPKGDPSLAHLPGRSGQSLE
jgi:glycosyltransferase involved in cell wall biosynthesis